jgi:uncharacterized protein (DUF1800 family)
MSIEAVIAANRFGLGARPGELRRAGPGPREWLAAQIEGERPVPAAIKALPSSAEVFKLYAEAREARRAQRKQRDQKDDLERDNEAKKIGAAIRTKLAPVYVEQVAARYRSAVATDESFRERLVHFWTNHFAVSADKVQVLALAATLENEAIRGSLAKRFADMLLAVESHPAMILYLDNQASIGPSSKLAQRAARRTSRDGRTLGLNENLGREILELHTLGVNGGYTQADVGELARALTGWSVGGGAGRLASDNPGEFVFRDAVHEPGARNVLGRRYAEDGASQPRRILADLARHPATATHLATKLVRHFVADEPPAAAIARIAQVFRDTDGDLSHVHRALIELPQAWTTPTSKFKTPHEYVVSSLRMLDAPLDRPKQVAAQFVWLGQRPYSPGSPAGWPDRADQWDGPDALLKRIEWASALAGRTSARLEPAKHAEQALAESLSSETRTAITRAASGAQAMTLLLASPEFLHR